VPVRLRTKLLAGILVILLLQIVVTGGITLRTFIQRTGSDTQSGLRTDWTRVNSYLERLKHTLYTDIYQIMLFLRDPRSADISDADLRGWIRYIVNLTDADRILLIDEHGRITIDEWAGAPRSNGLVSRDLETAHFVFPRNEYAVYVDRAYTLRLSLVTGATLTRADGTVSHLYLITDIDKARVEAIKDETGADIAFFVGQAPIAASTADFSLENVDMNSIRALSIGNHPYEMLPRLLSLDFPQGIYLVSLESLLPERLYLRDIIVSYLVAFILTLAASIVLAMGITMLVISPFTRLSQWLHTYMDKGTVGTLDIGSRDEVGFLAGAFHTMITTLIGEKRIIGEQLEQIRFLNVYTQGIMNTIKAAIIVTGADGSIDFTNTYFLELVGESFERLRGSPLREVLGRHFRLHGPDGNQKDIPLDIEEAAEGLILDTPMERPMHFTAKIAPIEIPGGRGGSLIMLEDITEARRLWEKMMIAERVTSLGVLSAGMAHEINNPLGSILSHVKYLKAVESDREKLDSLGWIESETERIASIVARIRAYSASREGRSACADLNGIVRQTLDVLRFTLEKKRVGVVLALEDGLPDVFCAADELKQVVLNIILNACQASPDGGTIEVRTASVPGNGSVALEVIDRGSGIEPGHMKNIFDPFFTTKSAQEGTGLGLSICFAIVKKAGGDIRVQSTPGKGTGVEVMLNAYERADH
jgi:signal transduction histidine kinase